ncbi:NifU N-terminal domain-containing protein [Paenibacillus sp. SN-8-1]|uniref:NifU N-terminal domain-containing protein n=1 Tax=Paenibacillus sp. SN-8-1 TaxID=3435409 RepID=UPI003D9A1634
MEIDVQYTPNPNSIKISTSEQLFEGPRSTSLKRGDATDHPLAKALLSIEGIDNLFAVNDFVTITKTPDADWDTILTHVEEAFNVVYG